MRYATLEHELDAWVGRGLVSPEQAEAIRRRYERRLRRRARGLVRAGARGHRRRRRRGLGVILFFAANWDAIPRPAAGRRCCSRRCSASYAAGYLLRERAARRSAKA